MVILERLLLFAVPKGGLTLLRPLYVEIRATRYALAIQTLRRAKRSWHRLDAALVNARNRGTAESELEGAWQALATMDQELDRLAQLLS
jgi:hypothetical protein